MNSADAGAAAGRASPHMIETADGLRFEVLHEPGGTRVVAMRGACRRVLALHAFVEERTRSADRARGAAIASVLAATRRALVRTARQPTRSGAAANAPSALAANARRPS